MNDAIRLRIMAYHRAAAKRAQRAAHKLYIRKQGELSERARKRLAEEIEIRFASAEMHTIFANALKQGCQHVDRQRHR